MKLISISLFLLDISQFKNYYFSSLLNYYFGVIDFFFKSNLLVFRKQLFQRTLGSKDYSKFSSLIIKVENVSLFSISSRFFFKFIFPLDITIFFVYIMLSIFYLNYLNYCLLILSDLVYLRLLSRVSYYKEKLSIFLLRFIFKHEFDSLATKSLH